MKITITMHIEDAKDANYLFPVVRNQIKLALAEPAEENEEYMDFQGVNCSSKVVIEKK